MLPVFERNHALLWYPLQYEGFESSESVFYGGSTPAQQLIPGLEFLREMGKRRLLLIGSDYVFPRTANRVVADFARTHDMEVLSATYLPLGGVDFDDAFARISAERPDAIVNTLNGDSNVAFFRQFRSLGFNPETTPVLSLSVAEDEIRSIGADNVAGHLVAWSYFQSLDSPANRRFVGAYRTRFGNDRVTDDPIQTAYVQVHLWAEAVRKAGTTAPARVRKAAKGISFDGPGGTVRIDPTNQHLWKVTRVGVVEATGEVRELWNSEELVAPDPFLVESGWARGTG